MSLLRPIPALILALLPLLGGCHSGTSGLYASEVAYLVEDLTDMMTVVFQAGENAYVGDVVAPIDVVDPAGPGNAWTVTYDLPYDIRIGLGEGFGRAARSVFEDGLPSQTPLDFGFGSTNALVVEMYYELQYEGTTRNGRITNVDLVVELFATRASVLEPFLVEYYVDGICDLDITFCDVNVLFRSPGRPRDGVEPGYGDGDGRVDDPDVVGILDFDIDWRDLDYFRVEGDVGNCCYFKEPIFYDEVF